MRKRTQILSGLAFLISLLLTCCKLPQHHRDLSEVMQDQLRRELNLPLDYPCTHGAHRGDSINHLENTAAALIAANENPDYAFIEFDIQYSKDREIIIFHDGRLRRLYQNFSEVDQLNYADLNAISQGAIPHYYDIIDQLDKPLNIEIKSNGDLQNDQRLADELIQDLQERDLLGRVMISSISEELVHYIVERYPMVASGQIYWIDPSTYLHLDSLTRRFYSKFQASRADYLVLHVENLRNVEKLIELKPKNKALIFWNFADDMFLLHSSRHDRMWTESLLSSSWRTLCFRAQQFLP